MGWMEGQDDPQGQTTDYYDHAYGHGYGISHPESHVVRLYHQRLKTLGFDVPRRVLDYGCGNGTHARFFRSLGHQVVGMDTSRVAIDIAKGLDQDHGDDYMVAPSGDFAGIEDQSLDFFFSNQVLYYIDPRDWNEFQQSLVRILKPGGLVYGSFISKKNHLFSVSRPSGDGRHVYESEGEGCTYLRYLGSKDEMKNLFPGFDVLMAGDYDCDVGLGSIHHYQILGRKS